MMNPSPQIAAMAGTLLDRGADLTDDRAAILCLVRAGYDAREIGDLLDLVIARAHRMRDAREVLQLDAALGAVGAIMRAG